MADPAEQIAVPGSLHAVGGGIRRIAVGKISHKDKGLGGVIFIRQLVADLLHDGSLVVIPLVVERKEAVKVGRLPPGDKQEEDQTAAADDYGETPVFQNAGVDQVVKVFRVQVEDEGTENHQGDGCPVIHDRALDD